MNNAYDKLVEKVEKKQLAFELNELCTEPVKLPSYKELCDVCPIPNRDDCLKEPPQRTLPSPLLVVPSDESEPACINLSELPMKGNFVSNSGKEKRSILRMKAIERQREFIGELTPDALKSYLPLPQEAPDHEHAIESPPRSFIGMIKSILAQPDARKDPPPFKFATDEDSINRNAKTLESHDYDMEKVLKDYSNNNVISPGSEFRETHLLGPLLHSHPYWIDFKNMMENGVDCEFEPIDEDQHMNDLKAALKRGNHKSASSKQDLLESLVADDIKCGFQVPIPRDIAEKIKGAVVAPCGIANQSTINELGERIEKDR